MFGAVSGEVRSVKFSDDSKKAVTASMGKPITVWDVVSGKPVIEMKHLGQAIYAEFSPGEAEHVVGQVAGNDIVIAKHWHAATIVWETVSGHEVAKRALDDAQADSRLPRRAAVFAPDGSRIANVMFQNVLLWTIDNAQTRQRFFTWDYGSTFSLTFSPDGTMLATSDGESCSVWNCASGKEISRFTSPLGGGTVDAVFSPDGKRLLTAGYPHATAVWDIARKSKIFSFPRKDENSSLSAVAYDPHGKLIAIGREGGETTIWELPPDAK